jgi:hypothetical protein
VHASPDDKSWQSSQKCNQFENCSEILDVVIYPQGNVVVARATAVLSFLVVNILAYLHSLSCFSELFDRSLALTLQLAGKQAQAFGEGCKPYGQDLFKLGIHVLVHLVYRLERYYRAAQQQRQGDDVFHSDKLSQSSIPLFWQLLLCWTPNGRIRRGGI